MSVKFRGDQRRFSWLIFVISMIEVILWIAPPVSAITSRGTSITMDSMYRNHMMKDKDHYNHAGGINTQSTLSSPRDEAVERMLAQESYVRL